MIFYAIKKNEFYPVIKLRLINESFDRVNPSINQDEIRNTDVEYYSYEKNVKYDKKF